MLSVRYLRLKPRARVRKGRRRPPDRVFALAMVAEEIVLHSSAWKFARNLRLACIGSLKIEIATACSPGMAMALEKLLARRQAATFMQTVLIDMHAGVETCFIAFD